MTQETQPPLQIKILSWFGMGFGIAYILYAVVSIVLSFLDRTYADIENNFVILLYGLPFIIFAGGLKKMQRWGWYGYAVLLGLVVILSMTGPLDVYGVIVGVIALAALVTAVLPPVRRYYF